MLNIQRVSYTVGHHVREKSKAQVVMTGKPQHFTDYQCYKSNIIVILPLVEGVLWWSSLGGT